MGIRAYILLLVLAIPGFEMLAQASKVVYLSGTGFDNTRTWDFYCSAGMNSGKWTTIEVPSCWEQQGFGEYNYGHVPFEERLNEEGHYRTSFHVEKEWKGQVMELVFEGVMTDALVLVNGNQAGEVHQGAFYPFSYDISKLVRYGRENKLEVRVKKHSDNTSVSHAERKSDYWIFGGIFRPVYLRIYPREHIAHLAVDARADGTFRAEPAFSGLKGDYLLETRILDREGNAVYTSEEAIDNAPSVIRIEGSVPGVLPWSPEYPNLYAMEVILRDSKGNMLHSLSEQIGFRTVEVRPEDGIYVNGERVRLKGVNRHSFHPDHGRTSSKALSIEVVNLIKDMNMNAVRMSHYPPDRHFLDVCDSLGLFVLDELAGWQSPSYDSIVGRKLLQSMIARDVNHPCIVLWDNGNEGGWNTAYDEDFGELDIQGRSVLHPWAVHEHFNTAHYIDYDYLFRDHFAPRKISMPTEFLHGLYDGGHGAGLEDYWERMWNDPLCSGGFLWVFADEAVKRTDTDELDSDGNHAPDGILGPYHEKEGSFYSIREIWAPVHFEKRYITPSFSGEFRIENRFHYTSLEACNFNYSWESLPDPQGKGARIIASGDPRVDPLEPGQKGKIIVPLDKGWEKAHVLYLEASDPHGRLIHRWSWPVQSPGSLAEQMTREEARIQVMVNVSETAGEVKMEASGVIMRIDKKDGRLLEVSSGGKVLPLAGGPVFRKESPELLDLKHFDQNGNHHVRLNFANEQHLEWIMHPTGMVEMKLRYTPDVEKGHYWSGFVHSTGAIFSFPEEDLQQVSYLGRGPYRSWKNRVKGPEFGYWQKEYNNSITGHSDFEYPEFKGYFANLYWAEIGDDQQSFRVYSHTPDLYLKILEPEEAPVPARTSLEHLPGELGFMLAIPAIGTKFKPAENLGPRSRPYRYDRRRVEDGALQIHLSFDFHH